MRTRGSRMSQSVGSLVEKFCAKFGCMVDWAPRPPAGASANASAAAGARFAGAGAAAAAAAFAPPSSYMYAAGAGPTPAGAPAVDRAGGGRREVVDRLSRALDKPEEFGEWKTAWNRAHGRWYWCVPYTFPQFVAWSLITQPLVGAQVACENDGNEVGRPEGSSIEMEV